jgi:hypothetical protein
MIRAAQLEGREVHKRNARRYARGQYANRRGGLAMIAPYGLRHGVRKAALNLDMRRGVMRKGILKTMRSPLAFVKTPTGFVIDLSLPNITVTGRASIKKVLRTIAGKRIIAGTGRNRRVVGTGVKRVRTNRRSFRVNTYIGHFADQKAPGLGSITKADERAINRAMKRAVDAHLATVRGATKGLTRDAAALVRVDMTRIFG